jgi:hypothetical protein
MCRAKRALLVEQHVDEIRPDIGRTFAHRRARACNRFGSVAIHPSLERTRLRSRGNVAFHSDCLRNRHSARRHPDRGYLAARRASRNRSRRRAPVMSEAEGGSLDHLQHARTSPKSHDGSSMFDARAVSQSVSLPADQMKSFLPVCRLLISGLRHGEMELRVPIGLRKSPALVFAPVALP